MTSDFVAKSVLLPVIDIDAALSFYCDLLGFMVEFRDGGRYASLDGGGPCLALASPQEQPVAGSMALLVQVPELSAELLERMGRKAEPLRPLIEGANKLRISVGTPTAISSRFTHLVSAQGQRLARGPKTMRRSRRD